MSSKSCHYRYCYPPKKLRILELFAGIGGLHWALKVADVPCEVVGAMEINPTVLQIYQHNFNETSLIPKNLMGLTAEEVNKLQVDAIIMSPPCQPFCRMGNRLDIEDNRTSPLSHITQLLPHLKFSYIFLENVQGFEDSTARNNLIEALRLLNFTWQEFMLTPKTVGVPNSRLRYYLIGKSSKLPWSFHLNPEKDTFLTEIPNWTDDKQSCQMPYSNLREEYERNLHSRRKRRYQLSSSSFDDNDNLPISVGDILDWDLSQEELDKLILPQKVIQKYYQAMDIVTPDSTSTCCFTKGYGNFVKGTGSILKLSDIDDDNDDDKLNNDKDKLGKGLRYFSPKEISRLMSYPEEFEMPAKLSLSQKYKSLGNSVNVYVVAILFSLLFSEPLSIIVKKV